MSPFVKAMIFTAAPIAVLSIASPLGAKVRPNVPVWAFLFVSAAGLWVVAIIVATVLHIMGKRQAAAGVFSGVGIGIVAWMASCFAAFAAAQQKAY